MHTSSSKCAHPVRHCVYATPTGQASILYSTIVYNSACLSFVDCRHLHLLQRLNNGFVYRGYEGWVGHVGLNSVDTHMSKLHSACNLESPVFS